MGRGRGPGALGAGEGGREEWHHGRGGGSGSGVGGQTSVLCGMNSQFTMIGLPRTKFILPSLIQSKSVSEPLAVSACFVCVWTEI